MRKRIAECQPDSAIVRVFGERLRVIQLSWPNRGSLQFKLHSSPSLHSIRSFRALHQIESDAKTPRTPKHFVQNRRHIPVSFRAKIWSAHASSRRF
jgi:hypothetical protein